MTRNISLIVYLLCGLVIFSTWGCKKLVDISEPVNTITTSETFNSEANAQSAVAGLYNVLISGAKGSGAFSYSNGMLTFAAGVSADEFNIFSATNPNVMQFQNNALLPTNNFMSGTFWDHPYYHIYMANAIIEGLQASTGISQTTKTELLGEAKFIRAYVNQILVNLYGDIPLLTTTDWSVNSLVKRSNPDLAYGLIKKDLLDAISALKDDYSLSNGERIRVNKWVANALMARVCLYTGAWDSAESQASLLINDVADFKLEDSLNDVFLKGSKEAIWQLQPNKFFRWTSPEANQVLPASNTSFPVYFMTPQLLAAFESGDYRLNKWVGTTIYASKSYKYPYKYKVKVATQDNIIEYHMMLRLAEQYLIRAEARAWRNKLDEAIADVNIIRKRAGLGALPTGMNQADVLKAIYKEKRIEFFGEWGHRWIDLKRWGLADQTLSPIKSQWKATSKLFPIPISELTKDPNLTQNEGY